MKWACTIEYKTLNDDEVHTIELKESFDQPIQEVWQALDIYVYKKEIGVNRQGHPLVCSNDGGCRSKIRILRDAATPYPLLTKLLHLVCE